MKVMIIGGGGMLAHAMQQVFCHEQLSVFGRKELDITHTGDIDRWLAELRPDVCINCAAFTDVDRAEDQFNICELVNAMAVKWLADGCRKHAVRLVHFSTEMVFGQEDQAGYHEQSPPAKPVNTYGRTKLAGERSVRDAGTRHWIIRTSWLFGPGRVNFVDKILDAAAQSRSVDVVADQWGCPTYTFDLARAVYSLTTSGVKYGTYHLTNAGSVSRVQFAGEILAQAGVDAEVNAVPARNMIRMAARPRCGVLYNLCLPLLRPWQAALGEYLVGIGRKKSHAG